MQQGLTKQTNIKTISAKFLAKEMKRSRSGRRKQ